MKPRIFLFDQHGDGLTPMVETPYKTEDILQTWLAGYPDLLPGDQINPESPRRWLLVSREMPVPNGYTAGGRWSLDHLFLDQDAVPTFVECKRAADSRSRREVVAQMLDYAANGIEYWSMERLRQAAAETAQIRRKSLDEEILELVGGDDPSAVEDYWRNVESNLRSGRVRLIFVADETSSELRRLVEFLNEKMEDVEVLIVEIRQFTGGSQTAVVPRVIGLTEAARIVKARGQRLTPDQFFKQCPSETAAVFKELIQLAQSEGCTLSWAKTGFALRLRPPKSEGLISFAYGWTTGQLDFYFGYLPVSGEEREQLRKELLDFGGFQLLEEVGEQTLRTMLKPERTDQVKATFKFLVDRIRTIANP